MVRNIARQSCGLICLFILIKQEIYSERHEICLLLICRSKLRESLNLICAQVNHLKQNILSLMLCLLSS